MSPPSRGGTPGQLDEISQAIGELKGRFAGIEQYIHDKRHEDNNVSQKIDGIGAQIAREVGRLKGEIQGDIASFRNEIEKLAVRVAKLESARQHDEGVKSVWVELLKSPIVAGSIGGLLAAVGMAWAFLRGLR